MHQNIDRKHFIRLRWRSGVC